MVIVVRPPEIRFRCWTWTRVWLLYNVYRFFFSLKKIYELHLDFVQCAIKLNNILFCILTISYHDWWKFNRVLQLLEIWNLYMHNLVDNLVAHLCKGCANLEFSNTSSSTIPYGRSPIRVKLLCSSWKAKLSVVEHLFSALIRQCNLIFFISA